MKKISRFVDVAEAILLILVLLIAALTTGCSAETSPEVTTEPTITETHQTEPSVPKLPLIDSISATVQNDGTVLVTWEVSADVEGVSYRLWYCDSANGEYQPLAENLAELSFTDDTAVEATERFYKVSAVVTTDGKAYESELSAEAASAKVGVGTVSNITASLESGHSIRISWASYVPKGDAAVTYSLWCNGELVADDLTETAYLHENIADLVTNTYAVTVHISDEHGEHSLPTDAITVGVGTVGGMKASSPSSSAIKVEWEAYTTDQLNADGSDIQIRYQLYTSKTADGEYTLLAKDLTDNSYRHKGLSSKSTHYYKVVVTAVKDQETYTSAMSDAVGATVQAAASSNNNNSSSGNTTQSGTSSGSTSNGSAGNSATSAVPFDWGDYENDEYSPCNENLYGPPYLPWGDSFCLEGDEFTLLVSDGMQVPYVYPGDSGDLTWSTNNPDVLVVGPRGYIVAVSEGVAVIRVTDGTETLYCKIRVIKEFTTAEKEAIAKRIAQRIADQIMADETLTTDLQRVAKAAAIINGYVAQGHSSTTHPDYNTAYGTLVAGYSSCAGDTRALGLVLECMGFKWSHVNEGEWDHQWCIVYDMDGKTGFADGSMYGIAGYGSREKDQWYKWDAYIGDVIMYN